MPLNNKALVRKSLMDVINRVGVHDKGTISLQSLLSYIKSNLEVEKAGAIATFTGIVRGYTHDGKEVRMLEVEACEEEANRSLDKITTELRARPGIIEVLIHHLVGEFEVGDDLVYVLVMGASRRDTLRTLEEAIERYKKEAAIWKREHLKDGTSYWTAE